MPLPEKALISGIRRAAMAGKGSLVTGIGDDCAVLRPPPGHEVLVTTDFTLEGVHFRREWHPPKVVGRRCLTRGLSDIAAMGGQPLAVFLSLALPGKLPQKWVDRFMTGLLDLAREFKVPLAGGDTAQSPREILADIVVLGSVPKGTAILRSGAKPGDRIYVTGELGGGSAALKEFFAGKKPKPKDFPRHFHPLPRVAVGNFLRTRGLATAMIDLSDGFSTDLTHICEESGVGAEIIAAAIPRARVGHLRKPVDLKLALHGGEDYELLFTAPGGKRVPARIAGVPITAVGRIMRLRAVLLKREVGTPEKFQPQGWEHFK
ncbi:MAG TPA: thiamine-phosphate kinase [Terriglobales bacterium]|nr:thiamine-phosphate kinase [Terriglobales bacterium]